MLRRWMVVAAFCFGISLAFASASPHLFSLSAADAKLRLNESATRFRLKQAGAEVLLAVENSQSATVTARVRLELLDEKDQLQATAVQDFSLASGSSASAIPLIKTDQQSFDNNALLWYRLRYHLNTLDQSGRGTESLSGIISLSEIMPDIFALRVTAPQEVGTEPRYLLRVRTLHPLTGNPVSNVKVQAEMSYTESEDGEEHELKAAGTTNALGEAMLEFSLPHPLRAAEADFAVTAQRDGYYQEAEEEVSFLYPNQVLVSTDKPLYQPGQTLHVRILGFDHNRHAIANTDGLLKIRDPEGSYIFRANFKTSRFGTASLDWPIPDNTRLGEYYLETWLDQESPRHAPGGLSFKVSRYDLPNFVVNVKPDRTYYLAGQNATVEVRADYLFGQPVRRGRVRVVRETERTWNYREQKYETEEGEEYEGPLDDEGRFIAHVDLTTEHEDFEPNNWARFRDLRYAAYLTDLTTGRTEQRRFDLRITRDPIHIYVMQRDPVSETMPLQFYLSTFYADGTPAQCEAAIRQLPDDEGDEENKDAESARQKALDSDFNEALLKLNTNRYGVAKVAALPIKPTADGDELRLRLSVRDAQGRSGQHTQTYWNHSDHVVRVEADKPLYRTGEAIRARLTANAPYANWVVDLLRGYQLLATRTVQLQGERAEIVFPFRAEFRDELTIVAYPAFAQDYEAYRSTGWCRVLYPRDRDLKLEVQLSQPAYRPGAEARADFRVRMPDGRAAESALGVVIFDKAIEERARTDQEFGGRSFGFYDSLRGLLDEGESLAGITRRDLTHIDLAKPLPDDLKLVAEMLLNQGYGWPRPSHFGGDDFEDDPAVVFRGIIAIDLNPVERALDTQYGTKSVYPTDEATLRRQMLLAGVDYDELRDPWEMPYQARFFSETDHDVLTLRSAGPDKQFDTADDFIALRKAWPYFQHTAAAIGRTIENYYIRSGQFIRDLATLKRELLLCEAIDLDTLRDRQGRTYQVEFGTEQNRYSVRVRSSGPNRIFESEAERRHYRSDDFIVSTWLIDYTMEIKARINRALAEHFKATGTMPQNDTDLRAALKQHGVDFAEMRDGWGNPYFTTFSTSARYYDKVRQISYAQYGQQPKPKNEVTPVTQQLVHITIRSSGADAQEGTYDDFTITDLTRVVAEESAKEAVEKLEKEKPARPKTISFSGNGGAIAGVVTDMSGAVVPGATITAKHVASEMTWTAKTSAEGMYLLRDLAPGIYEVRFDSPGFKSTIIGNVAVLATRLTKVDATLDVGNITETVSVTSDATQLMTESVSMASVTQNQAAVTSRTQIATPRLREYFPETLLWQPQLETDKQGRARVQFKLADNITTWKMSVVSSTIDGEIGIAEKEFTAFQPFFAEHDPPKILTEGDEIALPVVLRNYLDKPQQVNAEIKPESWFDLLSPARKQTTVRAGDAGQVIFDFRARASIKEGKQRITAFGADASDAIEKPVSVHPDGEEITQTTSEIFSQQGILNLTVPDAAINGSTRAELKIYPNLMAHALEGIEGILQRPYGCGEQTISSTYPNVMILRHAAAQEEKTIAPMKKTVEKARRYTQAGYERLLSYRAENGGFSYWGRDEADLALTAYALRFLHDAGEFIKTDEDVISAARKFILSKQQLDGRWLPRYWNEKEDVGRTAINTAFITRVLAKEKLTQGTDKQLDAALERAFIYLAKRVAEIDEPYLLASYALAAFDAGEVNRAQEAVEQLRTLAREEAGTMYWNLESNTPFYGWGLAGRIETTALVVRAFFLATENTKRTAKHNPSTVSVNSVFSVAEQNRELVNRGLLFLLRNKDRYGVWLSTQATINVLDTLISLSETEKADTSGQAEIFLNDKRVSAVTMPAGNQLSNPIVVDLSAFLSRGNNWIQIRRVGNVARASAQLVGSYYVPWREDAAEQREQIRLRESSALRLSVTYDRTTAEIGQAVICHVTAERVAFRGYGMLLAEIGLPPGADADRESLDQAVRESGWQLNHYDVLPDRVIVYLWPHAGGTKFSFRFKTRYGIRAQTSPSVLYDYYNPEARVVIAPARFIVR